MLGDEVQKLSVISTIPNLLQESEHYKGCMQKIIPKMNQSLIQGSTEYHVTASQSVRTIVAKKLVPPDQFVTNFLQSILSNIDNRDIEVSKSWFDTLLEVIGYIPMNVIIREVLPVAVTKGELSRPVPQRIMSCRILGKISANCDVYALRKDVFPLVQALCQDVNKNVRTAICSELPTCAAVLSNLIDKEILPLLNEFANDEECEVRVAAYQTLVDCLPYFSQDVMRTSLLPLAKKMIEISLQPIEDEMKVVVTKNYGKLCIGMAKIMTQTDKTWLLDRFSKFAQLGLPQMKFKERVMATRMPPSRNPRSSNMYLECRLNCAFNIPAIVLFSSEISSSFITSNIYPIICDLSGDPYFYVRRTIASSLHEVTRIMVNDNNLIMNEFIKLLKDDAEEVLEALIPNIKNLMELFVQSNTLTPDFVDETAIELTRALLKCESEVASTFNWRLHSAILTEFEVLPKCMPSDFVHAQFFPLVLKRIHHCRAVPCRLAAVRTVLVFLRYNLKASQRSEIRAKCFNELSSSKNFYDRLLFVRSIPNILDVFSGNYMRDYFFVQCIQLADDKVPNIRLLMTEMIPQLKVIAKNSEKNSPKLLAMTDNAIRNLTKDRDVDVLMRAVVMNKKLDKISYKPDPKDTQKQEEEKALASMVPSGKDWKANVPSSMMAARNYDKSRVNEFRSGGGRQGPRTSSARTASLSPSTSATGRKNVSASMIRSPVPSSQSLSSPSGSRSTLGGGRRDSLDLLEGISSNSFWLDQEDTLDDNNSPDFIRNCSSRMFRSYSPDLISRTSSNSFRSGTEDRSSVNFSALTENNNIHDSGSPSDRCSSLDVIQKTAHVFSGDGLPDITLETSFDIPNNNNTRNTIDASDIVNSNYLPDAQDDSDTSITVLSKVPSMYSSEINDFMTTLSDIYCKTSLNDKKLDSNMNFTSPSDKDVLGNTLKSTCIAQDSCNIITDYNYSTTENSEDVPDQQLTNLGESLLVNVVNTNSSDLPTVIAPSKSTIVDMKSMETPTNSSLDLALDSDMPTTISSSDISKDSTDVELSDGSEDPIDVELQRESSSRDRSTPSDTLKKIGEFSKKNSVSQIPVISFSSSPSNNMIGGNSILEVIRDESENEQGVNFRKCINCKSRKKGDQVTNIQRSALPIKRSLKKPESRVNVRDNDNTIPKVIEASSGQHSKAVTNKRHSSGLTLFKTESSEVPPARKATTRPQSLVLNSSRLPVRQPLSSANSRSKIV